jgi:hypothetical protein
MPRAMSIPPLPSRRRALPWLVLACLLGGCSTMYYAAMSQLGWERRDILVHRIEVARDSLRATGRALDAAWRTFHAAAAADADAAVVPAHLQTAYAHTDASARDAQQHVAAVESAGRALFEAWREDVAGTEDAALRTRDAELYERARARYDSTLAAMRQALAGIPPVLDLLRDQAAFLQRDQGPAARGALRAALAAAVADAGRLQQDIGRAIIEANASVQQLAAEPDVWWWPL